MMGELGEEVIDSDIEGRIKHMRDMGSEVMLVIDDAGDGRFKARFIGQGCEVECDVGKGLVMGVRSGMKILVNQDFSNII